MDYSSIIYVPHFWSMFVPQWPVLALLHPPRSHAVRVRPWWRRRWRCGQGYLLEWNAYGGAALLGEKKGQVVQSAW